MKVTKLKMTPEQQAEMEYTNSQIAKQQATIEYVAMMSDIDLPEENESEVSENE